MFLLMRYDNIDNDDGLWCGYILSAVLSSCRDPVGERELLRETILLYFE